ncbi:MAG: hypothetical protein HPAVJP_4230 [Candidatus Hepatoplasma vulgare]|nr:MAG: hypothetical protein HPAVJP_4230 [Candidatus Hepatoplasma sp.]
MYLNKSQKTEEKISIPIDKEKHLLNVYNIHILDLKFNPFNTRIFDLISSNEKFRKMSEKELKDSFDVQKFIFEELKKDHENKKNKELKESIKNHGVVKPLISLSDGLLLSGNNRLSLLRTMSKKYEYVRVAIYEENLTKNQIIKNELMIQNEFDIKLDYENMSKVIRILDLKKKGISDDEISKMTGFVVKQNEKIGELYTEFLFYAGVPERYDYYRNFKNTYSMLDSLSNTLEKKTGINISKKIKLKITYFNLILTTNFPVQKIRDHINKIMTVKPYKKQNEIFENFIEKINAEVEEPLNKIREINFNDSEHIKDYLKNAETQSIKEEKEEIIKEIIEENKEEIEIIKNEKKNTLEDLKNELEKNSKKIKNILSQIKINKYENNEEVQEIILEIGDFLNNYGK